MTGENLISLSRPRLLFEKVNFNGRTQIGQPAHAHDFTGLLQVECLTSTEKPYVYSKDKRTRAVSI